MSNIVPATNQGAAHCTSSTTGGANQFVAEEKGSAQIGNPDGQDPNKNMDPDLPVQMPATRQSNCYTTFTF